LPKPEPEAGRDDRDRDVITLREAAEYLNCHYGTIYRLVRVGDFPAFRLGGSWRVQRSEIEKWIAGGGGSPSEKPAGKPDGRARGKRKAKPRGPSKMKTPKWPAELPQTYDVVVRPMYEPVIVTPMGAGERRRRISAYHKIETRRLHGILTDAQVGILQDLVSIARRFQWGDEQGVKLTRWSQHNSMEGWTVELVVDVFPAFPSDDEA
jgi:excisionase family DNA binding protein